MDGINKMDGMGQYGMQPDLWDAALFVLTVSAAIFLVNGLLRKILGVERKKYFSTDTNYFNERHQKLATYLRYGGAAISVLLVILFMDKGPLIPLAAMLILGAIEQLFTAYMEKRHSENPNDYKYTLLHSATSLVIIATCAAAIDPEFVSWMFEGFI